MSEIASPVQRVGVAVDHFEPVSETIRAKSSMLRFGVFELDRVTGELRKEGRLIHLRMQPVNVLRMLLEHAGSLVTRREITKALWPDDLDVDVEQGLNHCMKEIRATLGDRPDSPRFIQTLPRRGYRFLIEVQDSGQTAGAIDPKDAVVTHTTKPSTGGETDADPDHQLSDGRFE